MDMHNLPPVENLFAFWLFLLAAPVGQPHLLLFNDLLGTLTSLLIFTSEYQQLLEVLLESSSLTSVQNVSLLIIEVNQTGW